MKKNHILILVLSTLLIPSLASADGDTKVEDRKSKPLAWRPATDYVLPEGTTKVLIEAREVREPLPSWWLPVAVGSAIGFGTGLSVMGVGLNELSAKTPESKEAWQTVSLTGGVVAGVSLIGLIVVFTRSAIRPPATHQITVTPMFNTSNSGLMMTGTF